MFSSQLCLRPRLLAAGFLLSSIGAIAAPPETLASSTAVEEAGFDALASDRLDLAEQLFRSVLKERPESAPSLAGIGMIEMRRRDFRAAEGLLEQARRLAPSDPVIGRVLVDARYWARIKEGDAARSRGLAEQAEARYREAMALKPDHGEAAQRLEALSRPQAPAAPATDAAKAVITATPAPAPAAASAEIGPREEPLGPVDARDPAFRRWATLRPLAARARTLPLSPVEAATLSAAAYADQGRPAAGLEALKAAPEPARSPTLIRAWQVQRVRLMILHAPKDQQTYATLRAYSGRPGMTSAEIADYRELWVVWSLAWAEATAERGDPDRALQMLERTQDAYPADSRIRSAAARMRERMRERRRAAYAEQRRTARVIIHGLGDEPTALKSRPQSAGYALSGGIRIAGV